EEEEEAYGWMDF
nr:Chain F, gastrin peptide [synthetic construct]5WRJ_H Chain H, gastrin peptide [synthetic construct]5WRJ_J Chain J, gastrin peptide [synthetic construct]5WRJ_L Chain L, gastrin peptide [synthetic construct]